MKYIFSLWEKLSCKFVFWIFIMGIGFMLFYIMVVDRMGMLGVFFNLFVWFIFFCLVIIEIFIFVN